LVAFGFLNIQIISRGDYVDRVYRVTEKGDRMLVDALKDGETEALFNNLNYVLRA
jgi:DNA-binding PadR family transcriptional regulator